MATRLARDLLALANELTQRLSQIDFSSVTQWVYNPYDYAIDAHRVYLKRFAASNIDNVFMGMNPGPWGMAQTGIPFGEVAIVRDWFQLKAKINKPALEHPKRPIEGLACKRSEVSGARLWSFFRDRHETPEAFFKYNFVLNYCPLVFMDEGGRNLTPDKLPKTVRAELQAACDVHMEACIELISPKRLIGIGNYAFDALTRAKQNLDAKRGNEVTSKKRVAKTDELIVLKILHPSPASPASNRGWSASVETTLKAANALRLQ
jgi:single-strand selective monofunctional uracil DNA glycosylase